MIMKSQRIYQSMEFDFNPTCGIIGVASSGKSACDMILEGLVILQNRGYDSAGIVTIGKDQELNISKYASRNTTDDALVLLKGELKKHENNNVGIGHTRWATHGPKTDENAHPHADSKNRVAVVHNGVIENFQDLKTKLIKENGIKFKSQTDTEVIAQLIGIHLDKKISILESIKQTISLLQGTWGLCILSKEEPGKIYVARNGSPMLIGLGQDIAFVASESSAFVKYTREMISLKNGEIAVVTHKGVENLIGSSETENITSRVIKAEKEEINLTPDPYPHWTIKEIMEQPQTLSATLNYGGRIFDDSKVKLGGLESNKEWLKEIKNLLIVGCGTSSFAGMYGARIFRLMRTFNSVRVVDAADLDTTDFPKEGCGVLAISQSGETRDVVSCLNLAQENNIPIFSIVNRVGSLISRITGCGVYINAGREIAVASTKAFSSQVTALALVAIWFSQIRNSSIQLRKQLVSALHRLPTTIGMIHGRVREKAKAVGKYLIKNNSLFVLGRGLGEPIAREGALKIKEITYLHAEAYGTGALKHGPFALISKGTPIILLIFDDKHFHKNMTCLHEVKSRGAFVICITDAKEKVEKDCDICIDVPSNGLLTYLNSVIVLQLIAYEASVMKGINPDKPKNLAKTVTVQ